MPDDHDATPTRHVEVERKFDVDESTSAPTFTGLDVIGRVERQPVQVLRAVYFDTPDRDLTAHRITLRRRTGGSDAGWHLKLPAAGATRTEIRAEFGPGNDAEVPAVLRDMVRAVVQDRPLEPIAQITNQRMVERLYGRDGTALAEFCDDRVSGSAAGLGVGQRWREWELELSEQVALGGGPGLPLMDLLSDFIIRSGGQPSEHVSKLARVLGLPH